MAKEATITAIFGTAGFAKEVDWLIHDTFKITGIDYRPSYFVAEKGNPLVNTKINMVDVIDEETLFKEFRNCLINCFIAVGSPTIRKKIVTRIKTNLKKVIFPNLIHPSVCYDSRKSKLSLGEGNIICAGSVLTTDIVIKDFVHINLNSTIGHDCNINSFVTISPGVHISGNVIIGASVFFGSGAVVGEKLFIKDEVIIGAGSVVLKSIEDVGTYVGAPAKKIK